MAKERRRKMESAQNFSKQFTTPWEKFVLIGAIFVTLISLPETETACLEGVV